MLTCGRYVCIAMTVAVMVTFAVELLILFEQVGGHWHLRVRITQTCQISCAGAHIQVAEDGVVAVIILGLAYGAVFIGNIAEDDRARRANLLASRADEAIGHLNIVRSAIHNTRLHFLSDLGILYTLLTEGALLHYAAHANRNFRISAHTDKLRGGAHLFLIRAKWTFVEVPDFAPVPIEKVKAANFIRTIVCAIASAYATIVGHYIKALLIVHSGVDGAYLLAWCHFAVLAHHRHYTGLWIAGNLCALGLYVSAAKVAVQAYPVHFATTHHLILAHDWDVVFRLASDYTGVATRTSVQVNAHSPLLESRKDGGLVEGVASWLIGSLVLERLILIFAVDWWGMGFETDSLCKCGVGCEIRDVAFAYNIATFQ